MLTRSKSDNNNLLTNLQKERSGKIEAEKNVENLENFLKERNSELKRVNAELDNSKLQNEKLTLNQSKANSEIERYKNHIMLLTSQNEQLSDELQSIIERDEKIILQLDRKGRLDNLVSKNRNTLNASLNNLDEFINKNNSRTMSPNYLRQSKN